MEIDKNRFPFEVVKIIEQIAECHFIAIDLEFTGLANRRYKPGGLSLQEFYEDTKAAAEAYQILQFGMTIVTEDVERGAYVLRPYNFNINPVPMKSTKIERIWSFQSGAVEFLTRHNFDFDKPYKQGIQYLSRKEASEIRNQVPEQIPDIPVKSEDHAFVNAVRHAIDQWLSEDVSTRSSSLNLPPETTPAPVTKNIKSLSSSELRVNTSSSPGFAFPASLSRYQMRLVYQTVRNEYDRRIVALGNRNWIQLMPYDQERQDALKASQVHYKEKDISKATEFRWLIEAIAGGDIRNIDPYMFLAAMRSDADANGGPERLKTYVENLQTKLNNRRRILIGHNLFTDLVMIHQCFIGDLPQSIQDFQRNIHHLFPAIIDTKYLATREKHQGFVSSSLEHLDFNLQDRSTPSVEVPSEFDRYSTSSNYHEAGFDSFLTAKVAIRLSTQIEAEKQYEPEILVRPPSSGSEGEYHTPIESGNEEVSIGGSMLSSLTSIFSAAVKSMSSGATEGPPIERREPTSRQPTSISSPKDPRPIKPGREAPQVIKAGPVNWANPEQMDNLRKAFARSSISSVVNGDGLNPPSYQTSHETGSGNGGDDNGGLQKQIEQDQEKVEASTDPNLPNREVSPELMTFSSDDETEDSHRHREEEDEPVESEIQGPRKLDTKPAKEKPEIMPPWDAEFWKIFGNRVRVYGCNEGLCQL